MSIVTLDEVKAQLGIDPADTSDDDELGHYVDGITAVVERETGLVLEQREFTERLDLCGERRFRLWQRPVVSLTSLATLDGVLSFDVSPSSMYIDEATGLVDVIAGSLPVGRCLAVYQAGYATGTAPENFVRGALVIIEHVWETQRGAGTTRQGVIGPEEIRKALSTFTIPNKAREWLGVPLTVG